MDCQPGERFGRLLVLGSAPRRGNNRMVAVRCDCGNEKAVSAWALRSSSTRSCGCITRIHGQTGTPLYHVWQGMLARCRHRSNYAGRGIKVCERWQQFADFQADMGATYKNGLTIERINNDGNYSPANCRWATHNEQARNKRNNRLVPTAWGKMLLTDAARLHGISVPALHRRLLLKEMNPLRPARHKRPNKRYELSP